MKRIAIFVLTLHAAAVALAQPAFQLNNAVLTVGNGTIINCSNGLGLTLGTGAAVRNDGQLLVGGHVAISGDGNFANAASAATGWLVLTGGHQQDISGAATLQTENLALDKQAGSSSMLYTPVAVSRTLSLRRGVMHTTAEATLALGPQAILDPIGAHQGSAASHIDGPMSKDGQSDFTFPIGDAGYFKPIGLTDLSATETFTAQYYRRSPQMDGLDTGKLDAGIASVSKMEYWEISRKSKGSARIRMPYDNSSGAIKNFNALTVSHWLENSTGTQTLAAGSQGKWEDVGVFKIEGDAQSGWIESKRANNFSPFTLGSTSNDNPLPVELVFLKTGCAGTSARIEWATASEQDNEKFILEESIDGHGFAKIAAIMGAGNSSTTHSYSYIDKNALGVKYYRLSQVDFDGKATVFQVVTSVCQDERVDPVQVLVTKRAINITILTEKSGEKAAISVTNLTGIPYYSQERTLEAGENVWQVGLSGEEASVLMVLVKTGNVSQTFKIVK